MRILIAEDDPISRRMLEATLAKWGYDVLVTHDGAAAWQALQADDAPRLAVLDWMMPGLDGVEICRRLRRLPGREPAYLVLLTARGSAEDVVAGLDAGADDYLTKPFNRQELHARLRVGQRVLGLQGRLADRVGELEKALAHIKQLHRLLPMCAYCKKIRDDQNYWQEVEGYLAVHADVRFSHGICPDCLEKVVQPQLEKWCCAGAAK
jgi:DNA-binding response OmpR family regulator